MDAKRMLIMTVALALVMCVASSASAGYISGLTISGSWGTQISGPWNIGYEFTVDAGYSYTVSHLGMFDANNNGTMDETASRTAYLYTCSGGAGSAVNSPAVATATVLTGSSNPIYQDQFFYAPLNGGGTYPLGQGRYVVSCDWDVGGELRGHTPQSYAMPDGISYVDGRLVGTMGADPNGSGGAVYLVGSFLIQEAGPIPEPAGLGLIGIALLALRRRS